MFPENTMVAFRHVIPKGIEFDVRKTKDNVPIVIHDNTLDRTTTFSGNVKDFTLKELSNLSIRKSSEKIPTLSQVLDEFKDEYIYDIEIKTCDTADLVVDAIQKSNIPYENFIVTSFKWGEIEKIREIDDKIPTGLISVIRPAKTIRKALEFGCKVVVLNYRLVSREIVEYAAARGIAVFAYTVNDLTDIKNLLSYGVKAIITDNPNIQL
ncbi:phosphodiesterase [Only Syngen Nebraska virus 5]|uniref:phosphodiesterase n=1 Tax=Only Syngen Nebraska virus 5 TaxID=1917232 RepID=UPI000900E0AF|nr:phosphodiesterase [Only Syngen Nebraska virus 5]APC25524.1 glycerophosphoryl diesterase phosphodiesterase [Only Syngen Nebraska virus 5]